MTGTAEGEAPSAVEDGETWTRTKRDRNITLPLAEIIPAPPTPYKPRKEYTPAVREIFHKHECEFRHGVFTHAGKIYTVMKEVNDQKDAHTYVSKSKQQERYLASQNIHHIKFRDNMEKRQSLELVYSTLKYRSVLEKLLEDCGFFYMYPEYENKHGVILVMMYDFLNRKFQPRIPFDDETLDSELLEIEKAILSCKTKVNASLARSRIKHNAPTIEHLLPDRVRLKDAVCSKISQYAWVNQCRTSMGKVAGEFEKDGWQLLPAGMVELPPDENSFMVDRNFHDVFIFPPHARDYLRTHKVVDRGKVIVQDKSSCFGAHSVQALYREGDDVIITGVGSGKVVAHVASLIAEMAECEEELGRIFVYGVRSPQHKETLLAKMKHLKVRNVGFYEDFLRCDPALNKYKKVRIILIVAECSKTGVNAAIDFIVNEEEDVSILSNLSQGIVDDSKLGELLIKQSTILKHAMKFTKVQAIIYTTLSTSEAENESVIRKSLEYMEALSKEESTYNFQLSPPVINVTPRDLEETEEGMENGVVGKFIKFQPSEKISGCFVATLTREVQDVKETAKDVLARAAATGLLDNLGGYNTTAVAAPPVTTTEAQIAAAKENAENAKEGTRKKKSKKGKKRGKLNKLPSVSEVA